MAPLDILTRTLAHDELDAPLPPQQIALLCHETGRITTNLRLALPHYKAILAETPLEPEVDPQKVAIKRELNFRYFEQLVSAFGLMHERNCGNGDRNDSSAGAVRNTLDIENSARMTQSQAPQKPKTWTDFSELMFAMPFHQLLEVGITRARRFDRNEKEYFRRQGEMAAYVEQVKKYGLAGGQKLKDPSQWWDERTEESGFWQQEIFKKENEGKKG